MRSCKYFPHVSKMPTFTNNRANNVLVIKRKQNQKNNNIKEYVFVWMLSSTRKKKDMSHVTDKFYHTMLYGVHVYRSTHRRQRDSNPQI